MKKILSIVMSCILLALPLNSIAFAAVHVMDQGGTDTVSHVQIAEGSQSIVSGKMTIKYTSNVAALCSGLVGRVDSNTNILKFVAGVAGPSGYTTYLTLQAVAYPSGSPTILIKNRTQSDFQELTKTNYSGKITGFVTAEAVVSATDYYIGHPDVVNAG